MGEGSDYLFHCLFLDNIILFGREHGDGSMEAGPWGWEQFFSDDLFSKHVFLCYDSKPLNFSHWHGSVGQGNDYLFCLISDYIFLFRLEHGFVCLGAWGRMWNFFLKPFFQKSIFLL